MLLRLAVPRIEEHTVDELREAVSEPPPERGEASLPARAFGWATARYRSFLQALLNGLLEYEALERGSEYAPKPVPAD